MMQELGSALGDLHSDEKGTHSKHHATNHTADSFPNPNGKASAPSPQAGSTQV
jgi:hypothetical protein